MYGVQGSNANTVISFNANNSSIVVDNSSENTSNSYGVSTTSSLINFSGNSNIFVYGNFGETYGIMFKIVQIMVQALFWQDLRPK